MAVSPILDASGNQTIYFEGVDKFLDPAEVYLRKLESIVDETELQAPSPPPEKPSLDFGLLIVGTLLALAATVGLVYFLGW